MEIWKFTTLMVIISALIYSVQGLSFTANREHWVSDHLGDEPMERLASQVAGLLKRSKSHQFYGLMGKRSDKTKSFEILQPARMNRRHKGDMFVGLMGKRSLGGPVTRTTPETSIAIDKPIDLNKQSADLQEEWDKLQYYW